MTIFAIWRDLSIFSNRIAKFSNQIPNRIAVFQIKSFSLKSNQQNGSNRDLNPNRDWDLPITADYSGCPGKEAVKWMSAFLGCFCYFSVMIPCSNLYLSAVQCILHPMIFWTHELNLPVVTMIGSFFSVMCRLSMADRCQQMSCMSQRVCLMSMVDTSVRTSALQWSLKSQLQSWWMLR